MNGVTRVGRVSRVRSRVLDFRVAGATVSVVVPSGDRVGNADSRPDRSAERASRVTDSGRFRRVAAAARSLAGVSPPRRRVAATVPAADFCAPARSSHDGRGNGHRSWAAARRDQLATPRDAPASSRGTPKSPSLGIMSRRRSKLTPWRHRKLTPEETAYIDPQRRFRGRCRLQPRDGGSGPPHPPRILAVRHVRTSSSWTAGTSCPGRAARPITAI